MILIGYGGHGFVIYGILKAAGKSVTAYCDHEEKSYNPFKLFYCGPENSEKAQKSLTADEFFISVGNNTVRRNIYEHLAAKQLFPINAIHPSSVISPDAYISSNGVMIGAGVLINPLSQTGTGVICNTGCIIEHECIIGNFSHIGPGAILCGNIRVGAETFVGAGSVVREGITIGNKVIIGAGSVVVKNVPDNTTIMGCPAK